MAFPAVIPGLISVLLLSSLLLPAIGKGVELSSSVILFYDSELDTPMYGSSVSQCELLLRRAQKHGGRKIQIIPTQYWYDANDASQNTEDCYPDNWADTNIKVDYYCSKNEWNSACEPFNKTTVARFQAGMQKCLSQATDLFDVVLIAPHLDPSVGGSKRAKWRNMLKFDPLQKDKYGYSYWDMMLQPVAQAANVVFRKKPGKTLYLAMGGEMGGTVLNHPASYLKIISDLRSTWAANPSSLKLGVTFYHAYAPGQIIHGPDTIGSLPDSQFSKYDGGYGPLLPFEKWPGGERLRTVLPDIKKLLTTVDFIGVSNYARAPSDPQPSHLEGSTPKLLSEFQAMGIDLDPYFLMNSISSLSNTTTASKTTEKEFIWNEFGLGGGLSGCGDVPGVDARIGLFPWLGITSSYNASLDPFKAHPPAKTYLMKYYDSALRVLATGGLSYRVHGAYLWNVASWDVQGIHTSSALWSTSIDQGNWPVKNGFADAQVMQAISSHNKAVNQ